MEQSNDVLYIEEDIILDANNYEDEFDRRALLEEMFKANKNAPPEWNMQAINADDVDGDDFAETARVRVVVLDSGVGIFRGIDLYGRVNLVEEEADINPIFEDMSGHGTGIASILAGQPENGVHGINPNVQLYSVKVLDSENRAPLSRIIQGIYQSVEFGANIITMSFGTTTRSLALHTAIRYAYEQNILMVGAAGNNGGAVEYPAAFPEVMGVAATGTDAQIADFSNIGDEVDIAAPGERILVSNFFGLTGATSGTSIAVAHAAGVASLIWERNLTKSNQFVRQLISHSAMEIENTDYAGLLDASFAMEIYDEFAENFDGATVNAAELPTNETEPEAFPEIEDCNAYVEGRWGHSSRGHRHLLDSNTGSFRFSARQIQLMQAGIVLPDGINHNNNSITINFRGDRFRGFHGHPNSLHTTGVWGESNYISAFSLITRIAQAGGATNVANTGLPAREFDNITSRFRGGAGLRSGSSGNDYSWRQVMDRFGLLAAYDGQAAAGQRTFRRFFIWGIALHSLTDVFEHSAVDRNPNNLSQWRRVPNGEDHNNIPARYAAASEAVYSALVAIENGAIGCCCEFWAATSRINNNNFRLANLTLYANQNAVALRVGGGGLTAAERTRFRRADARVSINTSTGNVGNISNLCSLHRNTTNASCPSC